MRAEDKQQIIAALRSGQYRQLKGRVHDGADGFCVMGLVEHLGIEPFTPDEMGAVVFMNHCTQMTFDEIANNIEMGDLVISLCPPGDHHTQVEDHWPCPRGPNWTALAPSEVHPNLCARLLKRLKATALFSDDDDDTPPPPLPAMIFIFPRRPVLSGAIGRRLPGRGRVPAFA